MLVQSEVWISNISVGLINTAAPEIFHTGTNEKVTDSGKTEPEGNDTLESFLSKVAFKSNLQKKLSRTQHVLVMKVSFERRKIGKVFMTHGQVFFRKSLSKATFERKLSSVSLP